MFKVVRVLGGFCVINTVTKKVVDNRTHRYQYFAESVAKIENNRAIRAAKTA